jgi:hypothetical protein
MRVRAIISFADAKYGGFSKGSIFEMPEDADWLRAKFVEPVGDDSAEQGVDPPAEAPTDDLRQESVAAEKNEAPSKGRKTPAPAPKRSAGAGEKQS